MPMFRKKPVVIEARQLTGSIGPLAPIDWYEIAKWCGGLVYEIPGVRPHMTITTLEGVMTAGEGDWIITGIKGEHYPCKPDIFAATYEPASRAPAPSAPAGTMKKIEAHNWEPFNIDEAREYLADCLVEHKSKHTGIFAVAHSLLAIIDGKAEAPAGEWIACSERMTAMIPFTPTTPPVHVFPESHRALAEKLSRAPWPDADREMRAMKAQSQAKYLAELLAKILRATGAAEEGIDGVTVDQLSERYRRQSTELFWDEMLIALNDATMRRLA